MWHRTKLRTFDKGKREHGEDLIPCPFTTETKQALFKASDMDINEELLHHPENDPAYLGLKVNQGVAAQPMVNPNLRRFPLPQGPIGTSGSCSSFMSSIVCSFSVAPGA